MPERLYSDIVKFKSKWSVHDEGQVLFMSSTWSAQSTRVTSSLPP